MPAEFRLPYSSPEAQGVSSSAVETWLRALDRLRFPNSFMLMRNGFVIAEGAWAPYTTNTRHTLFSLSKSFASLAIGFAVAEGRLGLDDRVVGFFPDRLPPDLPESCRRMTVRHLLTMATGHSSCPLMESLRQAPDGDCVTGFFAQPLTFEPGARFVYNSAATYMLSAIVTQLTGGNLIDFLGPRLLDPLGIANRQWDACPKGVSLGGWGYHLSVREIASFAQLLLDGGKCNGRQVLPASYLAQATAKQIDNSRNEQPDWKLGYGFQFWRSQHHAFRGDGAYGQYALVMPDHHVALAMTSGLANMQSVLTLVWDLLLPGFAAAPLPEDAAALESLRACSASLRLPLAAGDAPGRRAGELAFAMQDNAAGIKRISFRFSVTGCELGLETAAGTELLRADYGANRPGEERLFYREPRRIAASAAWKDAATLEILCCYVETPFIVTFICHFGDDGTLRLESASNLRFHTADWEPLHGRSLAPTS